MPNTQTADRHHDNQSHRTAARANERATLDQQYRAIGISAVAAAARYPNEKRRPVVTPRYTRELD